MVTLSQFASEFLQWVENSHSIEPKTRAYYQNGWRLLKGTPLANLRLNQITNHVCETVSFPGSNSNANVALRTLRRMLSKAKEIGKLAGDVPKIAMRKEWGRSVSMTMADAQAIAAHMKDGDARDAFLVLRGTGMRPKEAFSMRWEYFNWNTLSYQNPRGKTKTARRGVPLLGASVDILRKRHAQTGCNAQGWVFPACSGSGHMTTIHKAFTAARIAAGLPDSMVLYTARHGSLSDLAQVVSLKEVMQIGGHSSVETALRYQHSNTEQLREKLGRIQ